MSCVVQSSTSSIPRISIYRRSLGEHKNCEEDCANNPEHRTARRSLTPKAEHSRSHQRYVSQDSSRHEEPLKNGR
eukprot:TRINITY_DN4884_c0_g1_i1.p2 TRINITY_DN4884_c0_g1~~TRINITY_DN4884_c0_g1_i1.p2  ORF type:complete len:75 (-),score=1.55 TRINITY_DN4884_c0_g1_i1:82-306(-)